LVLGEATVLHSVATEAMRKLQMLRVKRTAAGICTGEAHFFVPSSSGADWLEDPAFQEEHRVGIHVLSPESDTPIPSLVTGVICD
jgi:hypothetical protein